MIANSLILVLFSVFFYIYWFYKKTYSYFEKKDIPFMKPRLIFGNIGDAVLRKKSLSEVYEEIYQKFENEKIVGIFNFHKRGYLIRDPEIIKTVFIKEFENFPDHDGNSINPKDEPLANHLVNTTGNNWKNLRIKLTPIFSTGKMKLMFPLIRTCGEKLKKALEEFPPDEDIDTKDLCSRYITEVIGSCAFGLDTNCLSDQKSTFTEIRKKISKFRIQRYIRMFFPNLSSGIIRFFKIYIYDKRLEKYFFKIVKDTINYREENKITRNDFLDLLIGLKNNTDINEFQDKQDAKDLENLLAEIGNKSNKNDIVMTTDLLVAQCFLFLGPGYETTSIALSFLMLELAKNPEIQNKLRKEITTVLENNENEFTYEAMKEMKYTDMVIAESLRKNAPAGINLRRCVKSFNIPGTKITVNKNELCMVSVQGLHMDKNFFERLDEFYPEHFIEEAISRRPNSCYMPFGEGPRRCIAAHFAKIQIKTALVYFIKNFSYKVSPKMKFPAKRVPNWGLMALEGGIWMNCEKIC